MIFCTKETIDFFLSSAKSPQHALLITKSRTLENKVGIQTLQGKENSCNLRLAITEDYELKSLKEYGPKQFLMHVLTKYLETMHRLWLPRAEI